MTRYDDANGNKLWSIKLQVSVSQLAYKVLTYLIPQPVNPDETMNKADHDLLALFC